MTNLSELVQMYKEQLKEIYPNNTISLEFYSEVKCEISTITQTHAPVYYAFGLTPEEAISNTIKLIEGTTTSEPKEIELSPSQKAKEIFRKMAETHDTDIYYPMSFHSAKLCALIAVDEIIENGYKGNWGNYWNEVREIILTINNYQELYN